ncbi:MAG: RNA polymerase sigma factor [Nocardioidaceae bacterium]
MRETKRKKADEISAVPTEPDVSRFTAFYQEHYGLVLTVAEHRLSSLHDAEEITSETFRVALQHHQEGQELTVPWLYGVVRNLVGNEYRRRTRQAALHNRLLAEQDPEPSAETLSAFEEIEEDSWLVRLALASLPEAQQEILKMVYWDELSMSETAAILTCGEGTVRARLFRARRALARALGHIEKHKPQAVTGRSEGVRSRGRR